jgi:hypothetical protein
MTKSTLKFPGRRLVSAGNAALVAGLTTTLLATRVCLAQPGLGISAPPYGASFIAGNDISLTAMVTNNGASVTRVDFLAEGALIGVGQQDPHGEWDYAGGTHLSVMRGFLGESMDYMAADSGEFFMLEGSYPSPLVFVGQFFTHGSGDMITGPVTVTLSFTADGRLNALINGATPLGQRTLSAGTNSNGESSYALTWPAVAPGSYTLRAVAHDGASQTVTSAPVNITVAGGKPHGSDQVKNLTTTGAHGSEWHDQEQQLGLSANGAVVAWHASTTGTNNISTNRIYCARSVDNSASFQPWVLVKEQANATFTFSPQWMAVDGLDVHLITISWAHTDSGQRLEYYRSTDGGEAFEPPQLLGSTGPGENFNHALIAASEGKVSIAVSGSKDLHPNAIKFLRSADGGQTFVGEELQLSTTGLDLSELKQSGSDVTLAWDASVWGGFWFDGAAHMACSSDAGATFTLTALEDPPVALAGGNHGDHPRVARAGTNVLALFVRENTTGTPTFAELFLRRSTDGGVTFGPPLKLDTGLNTTNEVPADGQFAAALDGTNVCVVFGTTDNQLYVTRSVNGGGSFSAPVRLADKFLNSGNPAGFTQPRLVSEPGQPAKFHLFWGGAWYALSSDAGATWTPPVNLMLRYSGWVLAPTAQVAADFTGGFHWAQHGFWNASDFDDWDVLYRRYVPQTTPAGSLNFAAHFAQDQASLGFLRYDNLQIPAVPALDLSNALSVECWVRLDPATLNADLVVRDSVAASSAPIFRLSATHDGFGHRYFTAEVSDASGGNNSSVQGNQRWVQPGVWYHLAMTFDEALPSENLKLYLNSELLGSDTFTDPLPASLAPILVSRFLDGAVDDLRFWNRALTAQEIRDRFTGPLIGDEPGLAAYYTFNGTWAESTGNGLPAVPMYRERFSEGADVQPLLIVESLPGNQVRLSWLNFGAIYQLQATTDLPTTDWQPVPGTPTLVNGRWTQTVNTGGATQFFRLQAGN